MTGRLLIAILALYLAIELIIFHQLGNLPRPEWPLEIQ